MERRPDPQPPAPAAPPQWRLALCCLAVLVLWLRLLVLWGAEGHPVGRLEAWPGSIAASIQLNAEIVAEQGGWLLGNASMPLTREQGRALPPEDWSVLFRHRLPPSALPIVVQASSIALTGTGALLVLVLFAAGAASAVLAAESLRRLTHSPAAALLGGLLLGGSDLAAAAVLTRSPGAFEVLLATALFFLSTAPRLSLRRAILMGLLAGASLWIRPVLALAALPMLLRAARSGEGRSALALAGGILVPAALLVARNAAVEAPLLATTSGPAWVALMNGHAQALRGPQLPSDEMTRLGLTAGLPRTTTTVLRNPETRAALPGILLRRLREVCGAREVTTAGPGLDYLRRRVEPLRLLTISTTTAMALGWAALAFLALCRRLPPWLGIAFVVLVIEGTLLHSGGRELLLALLAVATALALADVRMHFARSPLPAMLFLALWSCFLAGLFIDDHARGSRFRQQDFAQAALLHRGAGDLQAVRREQRDYRSLRLYETVTLAFWYRQDQPFTDL